MADASPCDRALGAMLAPISGVQGPQTAGFTDPGRDQDDRGGREADHQPREQDHRLPEQRDVLPDFEVEAPEPAALRIMQPTRVLTMTAPLKPPEGATVRR